MGEHLEPNESASGPGLTKKKVVVAIGGNAILDNGQMGSYEEQLANISRTASKLASIIQDTTDYEIVALTHGNGPQVGLIALQQDIASRKVPQQPMHAMIAMTQGQLGYMLQQAIQNEFLYRDIRKPVISIITQTLVDKDDSEFSKSRPSKPIGPFYSYEEAKEMIDRKGYAIIQVKPVGDKVWRRVVPSPFPLQIVESEVLKKLIDGGCLVIAGGGGGIPVIRNGHGFEGVDGVVDKDLLAGLLGKSIGASILMLLTDVDGVKLNFGKPDEVALSIMTLEEATNYYRQGHFLNGSMGPKVNSAIDFVRYGGEAAIITSIDKAVDSLNGNAGTRIVASRSRS